MAKRKRATKKCNCGNATVSPHHHKSSHGGGGGHHKMAGLSAAGSCKTWLTKYGTRMRGCYTSKGFRITGKA